MVRNSSKVHFDPLIDLLRLTVEVTQRIHQV